MMDEKKPSGTHTQIAVDGIVAKTVVGAQAAVDDPKESFRSGAKRWAMSGALLAVGYFCTVQKWPWYIAVAFGVGGFYTFSPRKTNDMVTFLLAKAKDIIATVLGARKGDAPTAPPPETP